MARSAVPITGEVLAWARLEAGLELSDLAKSVKVEESIIAQWETGEAKPSQGQFTKLVKELRRPSAIFFLPEAPAREDTMLALRRAPGLAEHELSVVELREIRRARRLQEIVAWSLRDAAHAGVPLPRASIGQASGDVAALVRSLLEVDVHTQLGWANPTAALRAWRSALESLGILTMQLQLDRNGIRGIRGFSMWDEFAPLVAVNSAYSNSVRIYTLLHEVGHLVTRSDGACFGFIGPQGPNVGVERWCERFAAAALMPGEEVIEAANKLGLRSAVEPDLDAVKRLAQSFKVSVRTVTIRLQELGRASDTLYQVIDQELGSTDFPMPGGPRRGQASPRKRLGQLGVRVPSVLFDAAARGRVTTSDLADYLRLTVGQVEDLRGLIANAV